MNKLLNFENSALNQKIKEILKSNGYIEMTDIQYKTIPHMLNSKDIIVQSQTGTGKTLSFVLPILHNYFKNPSYYKNNTVSVVISPTRELAIQITEVFDLFKIKCKCFIGGISIEEDLKEINSDIKIVVGTPGRLLEVIKPNSQLFSRISYLILDEADRLISLGFKDKVLDIVSLLPKTKSCGLFSATINDEIKNLSKSILKNPVFVKSEGKEIPCNLCINYIMIESNEKLLYTLDLVKNKKSIVFFSTCNQVDFFYSFLIKYFEEKIINIYKIHRKMKQEDRNEVYKGFYEKGDILLCTDIAARGIDFKNIDLVIHFDIPNDYNNIIHRSGRTARNGSKGNSILYVMPNEKTYLDYLKIKELKIEKYNKNNIGDENKILDDKKKIDDDKNEIDDDKIDNKIDDEQLDNKIDDEQLDNKIDDQQLDNKIDKISDNKHLKNIMDDTLYDLSVRAFVSYFRSYKEHSLTYILDYTTLNYDNLVDLYMLKKIPGMTELRNVEFKNFPREANDKKIPKKKKKLNRKN